MFTETLLIDGENGVVILGNEFRDMDYHIHLMENQGFDLYYISTHLMIIRKILGDFPNQKSVTYLLSDLEGYLSEAFEVISEGYLYGIGDVAVDKSGRVFDMSWYSGAIFGD